MTLRTREEPPPAVRVIERSAREAVSPPGAARTQVSPEVPGLDDALRNEVARTIAQLRFADESRKPGLLNELARFPSPGPAYLASLLESADPDSCEWIGSALVQVRDSGTLPYLIHALGAKRPEARKQALLVIAELGNLDSALRVRPLLNDVDPIVQSTAVGTLRQLQDVGALEMVLDLLKDPDASVRIPAINAGLEMGRSHHRMETVAGSLVNALSFSKGEASKDLLSALGRTGRKDEWGTLAAYLRDGDPVVRAVAASALATLASPESVDNVVNRLAIEEDKRVRFELAAAARVLGSFKAVEPLLDWLRSNDPEVVAVAAMSLRIITRQEFGADPERWRLWWEQARPFQELKGGTP